MKETKINEQQVCKIRSPPTKKKKKKLSLMLYFTIQEIKSFVIKIIQKNFDFLTKIVGK